MLRDKFLIIFLLVSIASFGQQRSKMLQASIQQASGGGVVDLFPTGNAASAGAGEANSTSGWLTNATLNSISNPNGTGGAYAIQVTTAGTSLFRNGRIPMTCEVGEDYRLDLNISRISGNGQVINWDGAQASSITYDVDFDSVSNGTYIDGSVYFTADATTVEAKFFINYTPVSSAGEFIITEAKLYKL